MLRVACLSLAAALVACGSSGRAWEVGDRGRGQASYISDRLAGRLTANGERYDPEALTAAHRTLPFGTRLRVTRLDTGAEVVVRINDRGPFVRGRVLDLSRAAARRLDMLRDGVVDVRFDILSRPSSSR
jgi:rare lipoprotein A